MALPFYTGQIPTADDFNALMPKADLSASSGSSLVGFKQAGTNTVERTVGDKLQERLTPNDFIPGELDDTLRLLRCINRALSLGGEIDLMGQTYEVSSQINVWGQRNITLKNGNIKVTGGTFGTGEAGAVLRIRNPQETTAPKLRHRFERILVDCNGIAPTAFYITQGPTSVLDNCTAKNYSVAGFWLKATGDGNTDSSYINCYATEAEYGSGSIKLTDYSARTAIGFYVDASADVNFVNCISANNKYNLYCTNFWNVQFTGCTFWSGPTRTDPNCTTVYIAADCHRAQFTNCRLDDGAVELHSFDHAFTGNQFIQFNHGQLRLVASKVSETAANLVFIGNTLSSATPNAQLLTEGSGSWGTVTPEWVGNIVDNAGGSPYTIQDKSLITNGLVIENGDVTLTGDVYIDGTKVVGPQEAGWTAATGTPNKGAYATYDGQTTSAVYDQAEAQATDDATKANSQRIKAIEDALRTHGLID
jgi:hypothetical protein